jgi:hypothetical protein
VAKLPTPDTKTATQGVICSVMPPTLRSAYGHHPDEGMSSSARWVLSDEPVHRFPDEVRMADVPRVFLDQVDQDAP